MVASGKRCERVIACHPGFFWNTRSWRLYTLVHSRGLRVANESLIGRVGKTLRQSWGASRLMPMPGRTTVVPNAHTAGLAVTRDPNAGAGEAAGMVGRQTCL